MLKNFVGMTLLTALEQKEDALEMTVAEVSTDFSEEVKRVLKMLSKAMNSVWYLYDINLCDLEELHEAVAEEDLAVLVDLLV